MVPDSLHAKERRKGGTVDPKRCEMHRKVRWQMPAQLSVITYTKCEWIK